MAPYLIMPELIHQRMTEGMEGVREEAHRLDRTENQGSVDSAKGEIVACSKTRPLVPRSANHMV